MVPASVGFQCPECVAQGRRETRVPRPSLRSFGAGTDVSVSIALIAINVVVWLAINLTGGATSHLLDVLALQPTNHCYLPGGGVYVGNGVGQAACTAHHLFWVRGLSEGAIWQLVTSAFTQQTVTHIFFNVLNLYIVGTQLERALGRTRFLAVYVLSALAGSAFFYAVAPSTESMIGASGAVFGLMGAYLVLGARARIPLQGMLLWMGINFAYSFFVPGIAWQAHVGGFVGGAAAMAAIVLPPARVRGRVQWLGFAAIVLAVVVSVALRSHAHT
jgi:membrane associated rhomboid family serine protease